MLGPGPVLDAHAFPVPIPKVCTACRTDIHVIGYIGPGQVLNAKVCPLPILQVCTSCRTNIHVINFTPLRALLILELPIITVSQILISSCPPAA